ncbi:hypothetical protein SPURM210S_04371 [Streptomyces purpurascens]
MPEQKAGGNLALPLPQVTRPDPAVSGGCKAERMDHDDEQLLRGRVYGTDHDPEPGRPAGLK